MIYKGRKVEFVRQYSEALSEVFVGTLIDFYPSANEGIYALIKTVDGKLHTAGVEYVTILDEAIQ